jgi:hypothetical protein
LGQEELDVMSPPQRDKEEMLLWMCKAGVWGE